MLVREVKAELVPVFLDGLQRGDLGIGMPGEAARIKAPCVIAGLAMDDLLCQKPAMAATLADPGAKPDDTIGVALAGDRPDQRGAIHGVGDRPVHHRMDTGFHQRRHPLERPFHHICHPVQIIRAQRVGEPRINAVHAPCLAVLLVESEKKPLLFLTAVIVGDRAAQQWHAVSGLGDLRNRFGDEILMLHRHHRMMNPHHRADLVHPVATGIDHDFGVDIALFGMNGPAVIPVLRQPGHRRMAVDLGPGLAGTPGERLAQLRRVDVTVKRIPQPPDQIVGRNQRVPARAFSCVDHLEIDTHAACHRGKMPVALHLRLGVGEADASVGMVIVDRIVRIGGKLAIERDRMALQPDHRLVHAEIGHLRGRMPGRSRRQLVTLDQHHVTPALAGQMIECRASGDAAADYDHTRCRFHDQVPHHGLDAALVFTAILHVRMHRTQGCMKNFYQNGCCRLRIQTAAFCMVSRLSPVVCSRAD